MEKIIQTVLEVRKTLEGAGVRLHRGFANAEIPRFDPFLLFDDFSSSDLHDFIRGFPWHPHRGIETVTYVLEGSVRHHDSLGNAGSIEKGAVQWMTAGNGILHEEMPKPTAPLVGFQLWVNLPKEHKMTTPRYQDVEPNQMPEISIGDSASIKVIAGDVLGVSGPVQELMTTPFYIDIRIDIGGSLSLPIPGGYNTFAYVIDGAVGLAAEDKVKYQHGNILHFSMEGDAINLIAGSKGAHLLLASGKPLGEEVAWHGPIVMNTKKEIEEAIYELRVGSFIKESAVGDA